MVFAVKLLTIWRHCYNGVLVRFLPAQLGVAKGRNGVELEWARRSIRDGPKVS